MSSKANHVLREFVLHGALLFNLQITNDVIEIVEQQQLVILEAQSSSHPADTSFSRVVHISQASEKGTDGGKAQGNHSHLSRASLPSPRALPRPNVTMISPKTTSFVLVCSTKATKASTIVAFSR